MHALSLETWDQLSVPEQYHVASQVARRLGAAWQLDRLELHSMGQHRHHIAFFRHHAERFALIPGATLLLGYDRAHPFIPSAAQQASWDETRINFHSPPLEEFLEQWLTPLRQVTIRPFLLETPARLYDISPVIHEQGRTVIHKTLFTRDEAVAAMVGADFRLPTSDEWEYACSAGMRTLFRWGDESPTTEMPAPDDPTPLWNTHLRPNAFGLTIAAYPYHIEYCAELDIIRGGDGGTALHAGIGTFAEWLTLASAFFDRPYPMLSKVYIRRALSLPVDSIVGSDPLHQLE